MSTQHNPLGREYTPAEVAAGIRVGILTREKVYINPETREIAKVLTGQMIYATGPYWPEEVRKRAAKARKLAADLDLVADAMDREWLKE